ncbi:unnamed protein product [Calypogeia fissa]
MGIDSFIQGLPSDNGIEFIIYVFATIFGLLLLHALSVSGRPVAHADRKLGTKHKEAEAERVEILERLSHGAKVGDRLSQFQGDGDDLRLPIGVGLEDVEKEPLYTPLLQTTIKEASEATITMSTNGTRLTSTVVDSIKDASKAAWCGELLSVEESVVYNPEKTMLQTKVELHDGIFERLKSLVKVKSSSSAPPPPKGWSPPVLQVDNWAILKPSDQGVDLLRLRMDEVPVILHAEYAAGLVTITGLNLEDASIFVSGKNAYHTVKLKVLRVVKAKKGGKVRGQQFRRFSDTAEDIMALPFRLSWKEMEDVFVYAIRKVQTVDGQSVEAVSKAIPIADAVWRTVFGLWLPCLAVWMFVIFNTWGIIRTSQVGRPGRIFSYIAAVFGPALGSSGILMLLICLHICAYPSSRFIEFFRFHLESFVRGFSQALLSVYYGIKCLKGSHLKFSSMNVHYPKPPPPPPPLSSRPPPREPPPPPMSMYTTSAGGKPVEDPDWEWPAFDQYEAKNGKVVLRRCSGKVQDDVSPFRVIYLRKEQQKWPDVVAVDFMSAPLIKIVQQFLPENGDLQSLAIPSVKGRDIFTILDGLRNYEVAASGIANTSNESNPQTDEDEHMKGALHLKHLIRFMDMEYKDVSIRQRRMTEERRVAWDMLWAFLTPGKKVVYTCDHTQQVLAAVVSKNNYTVMLTEWVFFVDLEVWDYDGRSYRKCQMQRMISRFDGEVAFSSLVVRPIELEGVPEILDEGFFARGKRFYELSVKSSHRFMHYSGTMFHLRRMGGFLRIVKESADGRVMIDLASFAKMNPEYKMGNAKPPVGTFPGGVEGSAGRPRSRYELENNEGILDLAHPSDLTVADETLIFAPAIVYGFSFTLKQWGSFAVSGFSEISFNSSAYDTLVMEPDSKQLVHKLVSQYIGQPVLGDPSQSLQLDLVPIANKGEGCIFLCYGPPGTGKTLTAESVAESMHRPLLSLTASELGVLSPQDLEETLVELLDIAGTWRAVLLLDEADVLLEKRSSSGAFVHSAMTRVFLRFLEFYRGVLFLTTNRIGTFDNAFRSRISMFLRYPKLSVEHKQQIWMMLLERAGVPNISLEFVSEAAAEDLNGHEIRNAIHTAQILAKSNGETLDQSHVRHVTKVLVSSLTTLSDTMRICPKGSDT